MTKTNKEYTAQSLAKKIRKKSTFYKTHTNALYMICRPLAHLGALPLREATVGRIITSITKEPCPAALQKTVLYLLMKEAEKKAEAREVSINVYFEEDAIHLNLGANGVVKVTASYVRVLDSSLVPFRLGKHMKGLPKPELGDDHSLTDGINMLWKLIRVGKKDRNYVLAWLLANFMDKGALPVLVLEGPEASVQAMILQILARLLDWNEPSVIESFPASEKGLLTEAYNRRVIGFDNVSGIKPETSDMLCRISSGVAVSGQRLGAQAGEDVVHIKSLIALSGVSTETAGSEVLDRALRVEAPMLRGKNMRLIAEVEEEFNRYHSVILGALLKIVQFGLNNKATLPPALRGGKLPDFAEWIYRCAPALGKSPERWVKALLANQKRVKLDVLSTDSVAEVLFSLLDSNGGRWVGRSMELFKAFNETADTRAIRAGARPTSARALTDRLKKMEPSLCAAGVTFNRSKPTKTGTYLTLARK